MSQIDCKRCEKIQRALISRGGFIDERDYKKFECPVSSTEKQKCWAPYRTTMALAMGRAKREEARA